MPEKTTIYRAKKIITMCPSHPFANHVAVHGDRILSVGELQELSGWGDYEINDQFADKIIMPGFVEGHSHTLEGVFWQYTYVGYFDRIGPDGMLWTGLQSIDAVVERLRQIAAEAENSNTAVVGWGFDPIYFSSRRMISADLDQVTADRPVIVMHASGHMLNANGFILRQAGVTADTQVQGVLKDDQGEPTGELQELAAMFMAFEVAEVHLFDQIGSAQSLRHFAAVAQRAGVTTATDLYHPLTKESIQPMLQVTSEVDYPIRLVTAYGALSGPTQQGIERLQELRPQSTAKLRFGIVKMMTDGSIQGFTARLKWPGYYNGAPNGIWNAPPEELTRQFAAFHDAGFQIHIHTNGDEASEVMLDAIESALAKNPRPNHRHTLQHCQMMTQSQLQRAASLGVCVNMFANHIYYWGEEHRAVTLGPERAQRIEPFASAKRLGVPFAMHSDAPVTPMAPLFTAWCATQRKTAQGRTLGEQERIEVGDALYAITMGAAYTLKMDHEIGSIETGKFADFAILEEDPLSVPSDAIKDVPVWGTVVDGRISQ